MTAAHAEALRAAGPRLRGWSDLPFFADGAAEAVASKLEGEAEALPPAPLMLAALEALEPEKVRVVVLGQDPYPTPGHGHGLAFSVEPEVRPLPRSLVNIFRELKEDRGVERTHGDLRGWARQGVLLLNAALTVRPHAPLSHARFGWQHLTAQVIDRLATQDGIAWVLWGGNARAYRPRIEIGGGMGHLIVESAHPSPLSARKGFFGSRPFGRIDAHLESGGLPPIDWAA